MIESFEIKRTVFSQLRTARDFSNNSSALIIALGQRSRALPGP